METKTNKQIKKREDIEQNWKECFVPYLPRMKRTKKNLLEAFDLGCKVIKKGVTTKMETKKVYNIRTDLFENVLEDVLEITKELYGCGEFHRKEKEYATEIYNLIVKGGNN